MAHIKVVRRSMRPEEWTDLRFGWLKRHIYSSKWEIENLEIRDARQVAEMQFEYYSEDYRPLKRVICTLLPTELLLLRLM